MPTARTAWCRRGFHDHCTDYIKDTEEPCGCACHDHTDQDGAEPGALSDTLTLEVER